MPVREIKPERTIEHDSLVHELGAEWTRPNSAAPEPVTYLERAKDGRPERVYVLWNKWTGIEGVERGEIIMEAAESVFGLDDALSISVVVGMTQPEAQRMGFKV